MKRRLPQYHVTLTDHQLAALKRLVRAVEAHLSAYAPGDEMAESDRDMSEALDAWRKEARREG